MKNVVTDINDPCFIHQNAFLIYRPKSNKKCEEVFYNHEALQILSRAIQSFGEKKQFHDGLLFLCGQWKRMINKGLTKTEQGNTPVYILDTLKSDRRFYLVKGLSLSNHKSSQEEDNRFIFILERMNVDKLNLSLISRQFSLNQREQDIVRLLIEERGNKEIAQILGLSLNTIKSYLKILMRKLSVTSRAGIIACLLTKK
ncbi:MAG: LuxR C-terminal-related transcriptional regulator [bacterium]